jgi:GST-like protein
MIDFFYYKSPNARKIYIMLEEVGLSYKTLWVDISAGEQFDPAFLAVNPNGKIPAIVDREGPGGVEIELFESGAILLYLAEKSGRLLPADAARRQQAIAWTFWQVGNQGPAAGQAAHFVSHARERGIDAPYARERFVREAERCYRVLDARLVGRDFIADEYSIADIACFPWVRVHKGHGVALETYPNVKRWADRLGERPAYRSKPAIEQEMADRIKTTYRDDKSWNILFGAGPATAT